MAAQLHLSLSLTRSPSLSRARSLTHTLTRSLSPSLALGNLLALSYLPPLNILFQHVPVSPAGPSGPKRRAANISWGQQISGGAHT